MGCQQSCQSQALKYSLEDEDESFTPDSKPLKRRYQNQRSSAKKFSHDKQNQNRFKIKDGQVDWEDTDSEQVSKESIIIKRNNFLLCCRSPETSPIPQQVQQSNQKSEEVKQFDNQDFLNDNMIIKKNTQTPEKNLDQSRKFMQLSFSAQPLEKSPNTLKVKTGEYSNSNAPQITVHEITPGGNKSNYKGSYIGEQTFGGHLRPSQQKEGGARARKFTSPNFYNQCEQYNKLQEKIQNDVELQQREALSKYSQNMAVPPFREESKNNGSQKDSSVRRLSQNQEQNNNLNSILEQLRFEVEAQQKKLLDQVIEKDNNQQKDSSQQSSNQQLNPRTQIEITQKEVTKIKEYYVQASQDLTSKQFEDSQMYSGNHDNSPFNLQQVKRGIRSTSPKSIQRKKHKRKKKVIETTKTTQFLITAQPISGTQQLQQNGTENDQLRHQILGVNNTQALPLGKRMKQDSVDRSRDTVQLQREKSRRRKTTHKLDQKSALNAVEEEKEGQYQGFVKKWNRRQEQSSGLRSSSKPFLSKRNSQCMVSQLSIGKQEAIQQASKIAIPSLKRGSSYFNTNRRMSLDKQLFINEGRGKIEQKYEFLETIGQGGFGVVKKVRHKITGTIRAMKKIQLDFYDPISLKNISNEVEILKQLDHPNIVKIYEFYQDKKNLYLIQEYIGGGDLFSKIQKNKGGLDECTAALILKQIISAVLYCHSKGIVHRDLKPENVLLEDPNSFKNIKVIDFGTSRTFQNSKKMNQKFGTAYYIAPEVLKKNYDEKCDIWSCGVILHILLSGYPPFRGKHEKEILEKIEVGYFSLSGPEWKTVSREAKLLLKQMLAYNPAERISAEQVLNHQWLAISTKNEVATLADAMHALYSLSNFSIEIKLQQAALLYIASQLLTRQELLKFKDIFNCFDVNGDGIIQVEELTELFIQYFTLSRERAQKEAEKVMVGLDINQNGSIDFTEFVIANVSAKDFLTHDKLLSAFNMLDNDGNGRITKEDLAQVFKNSPDINDEVLDQMIEEADENGLGEITFNEFKNLMLSIQKIQTGEQGYCLI